MSAYGGLPQQRAIARVQGEEISLAPAAEQQIGGGGQNPFEVQPSAPGIFVDSTNNAPVPSLRVDLARAGGDVFDERLLPSDEDLDTLEKRVGLEP